MDRSSAFGIRSNLMIRVYPELTATISGRGDSQISMTDGDDRRNC